MLLLNAELGESREGAPDQFVRILAIAPGQDVDVRGPSVSLLFLERRNDERRFLAAHGERHQALVRVCFEAGQIGDRDRARDVQRVEVAIRHPAPQLRERRGRNLMKCALRAPGVPTQCR